MFKRKYIELTVRGEELVFEAISVKELSNLIKGWQEKYKVSARQIHNGEGLPIEVIEELISELHKRYAKQEEKPLSTDDLGSLDAHEIGFMFGAISSASDKNGFIDPKVVLK